MKHCDQDAVYKPKGPHVGAYCSKCGAWIKWLSKAEKLSRNTVEEETDTDEPYEITPHRIQPNYTEECPF